MLIHLCSCFFLFSCREGILVAVEKGRYESVDDGIRLAVDVYVKAIQEYSAKKTFKGVYVHPITPVLDVTRPTVKKFTAQLKEKIAGLTASKATSTSSSGPAPSSNIVYLDFFDQLLTADGTDFNNEFHLDSTH